MYLWYSYTYAHFLVSKDTTQRDLSFQLKIKSTHSSMQMMEFQNHNLKKKCNQKHVIAPPPSSQHSLATTMVEFYSIAGDLETS